MTKLYRKSELTFALVWIGIYVVLLSLADSLSEALGIQKSITAPLCVLLTGLLFYWIRKENLFEVFGLCPFQGKAKDYLYFLPLILLASTNLWWGIRINLSLVETLLYIISMVCIGFLEEVIFRGFLFKALCKDNLKRAIVISSVTFGIGHIVNLLNGADFLPTLVQIVYAVAIGFLFTLLFYKSKSLWPCILTHSVVNSLSVFAGENDFPQILAGGIFLTVLPILYSLYLIKPNKEI